MVIQGNPKEDFRDQNPLIANMGAFKDIYDKRKDASDFIWAMYMIEEVNESKNPYAKIPTKEERIDEVSLNHYKVDVEEEDYKTLASYYSKYILTKEQALFKIQLEKLEELTSFLKNLKLDNDKEFAKYMSIMSKLSYIWDGLEKIKQKMIDIENKTTIRGNAKLSKRDEKRLK